MEDDDMDSSDTDYTPTQDLDDLPEDERNQVLRFISSADPVTGERDRSILNASSNIGNSRRSTSSASSSARPGPVQSADLQKLLSNLLDNRPEHVKKEYPRNTQLIRIKEYPTNLCLGITTETINPLLKKPEFLEKVKQHLPDFKCDVANEVSSTISSPQFQQALSLFSSGIESGQLASVMKEFGFGSSVVAAALSGEMDLFIKALQEEEKKKESKATNIKKKLSFKKSFSFLRKKAGRLAKGSADDSKVEEKPDEEKTEEEKKEDAPAKEETEAAPADTEEKKEEEAAPAPPTEAPPGQIASKLDYIRGKLPKLGKKKAVPESATEETKADDAKPETETTEKEKKNQTQSREPRKRLERCNWYGY
jgi:hypothetical protein